MSDSPLSLTQLREAVSIQEQIESLQARLRSLFGGETQSPGTVPSPAPPKAPTGKRTMSAEARERIAEAQRARWAKQKKGDGNQPAPQKGSSTFGKAKRTVSPEARARIAAAQRARWAKQRRSK